MVLQTNASTSMFLGNCYFYTGAPMLITLRQSLPPPPSVSAKRNRQERPRHFCNFGSLASVPPQFLFYPGGGNSKKRIASRAIQHAGCTKRTLVFPTLSNSGAFTITITAERPPNRRRHRSSTFRDICPVGKMMYANPRPELALKRTLFV